MEFQDKVVVITGANGGLGGALAVAFTKEGARLVLGTRTTDELKELTKSVNGLAIVADVANEQQVINLAQAAINKFGRIDIWVNNAGIRIPHCPVEELNSVRVHEMMEVNFFGTMYGSKAALIQMEKQKSGIIINILSTSALTGRANSSAYCASKYAAVGFTNSLRLEAMTENIKVIGVYPGGMKTRFFDEQRPADYNDYMDPNIVAEKIVANLKSDIMKEDLIIKRPQK